MPNSAPTNTRIPSLGLDTLSRSSLSPACTRGALCLLDRTALSPRLGLLSFFGTYTWVVCFMACLLLLYTVHLLATLPAPVGARNLPACHGRSLPFLHPPAVLAAHSPSTAFTLPACLYGFVHYSLPVYHRSGASLPALTSSTLPIRSPPP